MAPRPGEERGAVGEKRGMAGKERGGLDAGGVTGMGIKSWMVGRGHWCGIGRGRPYAISLAI